MSRTFPIEGALQISLDNGITWYTLTDHNRSEISVGIETIEKSNRMANGTLRKYVVSQKSTISVSWSMLPSKSSETVDYNLVNKTGLSAAWLEAFYYANYKLPMLLRVISATEEVPSIGAFPSEAGKTSLDSYKEYSVFMTNLSKTIKYRTTVQDFFDVGLEFVEI